MKTVDLIPFILLELRESDKYGFELTKAIETKSNGKIVIKQPTLYTLLKKLEKSKFISSYWEDSEIGGKRHYYKLTENGKLQVSTLPSYSVLMQRVLEEDLIDNAELSNTDFETKIVNFEENQTEKKISIMDELINYTSVPIETILPTEEVFAEQNLDNSTEHEINSANTDLLKDENTSIDEKFATNEDVSKFTEKVAPAPSQPVTNLEKKEKTILDGEFTIPKNEINVTYVDYVNFKNEDSYKKAKIVTKQMLFQTLATSASLILMIALCAIITTFTGRSALYYIFFFGAILTSIFYPIIFLVNMDKKRLKVKEHEYKFKTKLKILLGVILILFSMTICLVVNIYILKNSTVSLVLSFKNFENIYAPLLITSIYFLDILYNHLFLSKINK